MSLHICHLFGNWKWTGPADPALSLAAAQAKRHDVSVILGACPFDDLAHAVRDKAESLGLHPIIEPALQKHLNPIRLPKAASRLRSHWENAAPDIVHVHLDGDQVAADRAIRGRRGVRSALIRTVHDEFGRPLGLRRRWLFSKSSGLMTPSRGMLEVLQNKFPDIPSIESVGTVDLERFRPSEELRMRGRRRLGLKDSSFALGIVARIQRHRKFEVLLEGFKTALAEGADIDLVILGRGTHADELVVEPSKSMGISSHVHLPGYQDGEGYVETLAALDGAIYLVPGTDGSCRAVREEMAMGLPVLVSTASPLPEMIDAGVTGQVTDATPSNLAREFLHWESHRSLVKKMGRAARQVAENRFSMESACDTADSLYELARVSNATGKNH